MMSLLHNCNDINIVLFLQGPQTSLPCYCFCWRQSSFATGFNVTSEQYKIYYRCTTHSS